MVQRPRRKRSKKPLLGSPERSWIWGRHLVRETLLAGRWTIYELYLSEEIPPAERASLLQRAQELGIAVLIEPRAALDLRCRSTEHQGYLARMGPFPYAPVESLWSATNPLYLILDGMQDPYNFGAVLRAAEVFGVDGVLIGTSGQTGVTSLVARSSAGAVSRVPIVQVDDLPALCRTVRDRNIPLFAASEQAAAALPDAQLKTPVGIIIGNEGRGIRPELAALCTARVRIPQHGEIGSLNAAAAAAVVLYEVRRQTLATS